jgi:hypothetical protein
MLIMPFKPLSRQFLLRRRKDRLAEALDTEFAHERQARGCEEHFLSDGRGVGDVGDGDKAVGGGGEAPEDYVEGFVVF